MPQQSAEEQLGVGVAVLFAALVRALGESSPSIRQTVLSELNTAQNRLHSWQFQPKLALEMIALAELRIEGK